MEEKQLIATKIIAEFMGYKLTGKDNNTVVKIDHKGDEKFMHITEFNYLHWSALMPVYFKFQNELMEENINSTDNNYDLAKTVKNDIWCESFLDGIIIQSIQFSFDSLVNGILFLQRLKNENIDGSLSQMPQ